MSSRIEEIYDFDVQRMYYDEGMTQKEIADYFGVSRGCIHDRLHPEKYKEKYKEYRQSEKGKARTKRYNQSEKGLENFRKCSYNRRGLGFIQYNKPSIGTVAHHIDKRHVINIPDTLHQMYKHNVWTGEGMEEINKEAMDFYMYEICEGIVLRG